MYIYFFLIVFILLFALIIFSSGDTPGKRKIYLFVCFWPVFLIPALRHPSIGVDSQSYQKVYIDVLYYFGTGKEFNQEYGFILFNKLVSFISENPQAIIIATSFVIALGLILFIYYNSENVWLSLYLFITMYYFYFSMNGIRQFMAIVIVANAYYFARQQKLIPFILLILFASTLHTTALLGIFLYLINTLKPKSSRLISIFGFGMLVGILLEFVLGYIVGLFPRYEIYMSAIENTGGIMTVIVYTAIFLFAYLFGKKKMKQLFHYIAVSEIAAVMGILGFFSSIINRPAWYFDTFLIIVIPSIIKNGFDKKAKPLIYTVIMSLTLLYNLYYFSYNWHKVLPYKFFWEL
jgi:transmembrane protein EpsG